MGDTEKEKTKGRIREYEELAHIGLATAAGCLALISGADKVKSMLTALSEGTPTTRSVLPVVLFCLTILLGVAWYVSGKHELSLLVRYYGDHAPSRSFTALPLVIFVAAAVVLLSYFADNILAYSSLYAVYLLFAVAANWLSSQHVLKAYYDGKDDQRLPAEYRDEVYRYYVLRPAPVLGYLCGALTFLAIATAALGRLSAQSHPHEQFETTAYLIMISAIILGEAVIWSWRSRLYSKTRDL